MNELLQSLERKGFVRAPDGSWSKRPRRLLGQVETHSPEPATVPPLERGKQIVQGGPPSVGRRVTMVACRRRLLDPDAVAASMKALTDAIAKTLGVDDADPAVEWEWSQVKTDGEEGVLVKIESRSK